MGGYIHHARIRILMWATDLIKNCHLGKREGNVMCVGGNLMSFFKPERTRSVVQSLMVIQTTMCMWPYMLYNTSLTVLLDFLQHSQAVNHVSDKGSSSTVFALRSYTKAGMAFLRLLSNYVLIVFLPVYCSSAHGTGKCLHDIDCFLET